MKKFRSKPSLRNSPAASTKAWTTSGDLRQVQRRNFRTTICGHRICRRDNTACRRNLKLSVHSGSDKFSLYGPMHRALKKFGAGVHLKTAGTTWLEELIGLAEGGERGLNLAKEVYAEAYAHRDELCVPYASVIDIDPKKLPAPDEVSRWSGDQFASALRHDPKCPAYNSSLRQLLHVGFKVAAKMGRRYTDLVDQMEDRIAPHVTGNLYEQHIRPLFLGS